MEFLVEQRSDQPPVVHLTFEESDSLTTVSDALALAANAGENASVWMHGTTNARRKIFRDAGLSSDRTLLQMRMPLPAAASGIETRGFTDLDIADFVTVNNRAFDWHPEQSGLTEEAVRSDMMNEWFSAEGFRLHHIDGSLAAFCWTKIHSDPEPLGEIYVIAVDPDYHGQGLGKAMTLAGLEWLTDAGLSTAMLYVESDNVAAVKTYEKIGFSVHRTDTQWQQFQQVANEVAP